jgi:hypothetical protein
VKHALQRRQAKLDEVCAAHEASVSGAAKMLADERLKTQTLEDQLRAVQQEDEDTNRVPILLTEELVVLRGASPQAEGSGESRAGASTPSTRIADLEAQLEARITASASRYL